MQTIGDHVLYWSRTTPQAIAVSFGSHEYTYAQIATYVIGVTHYLKSLGLRPGLLVAPVIEDRLLELILVISLESLGAIRVVACGETSLYEKCDLVISDFDYTCNAKTLKLGSGLLQDLINGSHIIESKYTFGYSPIPSDICFISSTSGTTGEKKYFGESYASSHAELELMRRLYFSGGQDSYVSLYSMSVGCAYKGCLLALSSGAQIILSGIDDFLFSIEGKNAHAAVLVREIDHLMLKIPEPELGTRYSTLRILGSRLSTRSRAWVKNYISDAVFNSYSSNEASQIGEVLESGMTRLYPNVSVKIVNQDFSEVIDGESGFICVKSPQTITQYLWNEELNQKRIKDSWLMTDDLGYKINEEFIVLLERADDMLIIGGVKVPPIPIEERIRSIDGVIDVAVFAVVTQRMGSIAAATICLASDANSALIKTQVNEVLKEMTFGLCPTGVHVIPELPKTDTGKTMKRKLRELLEASVDSS